MSNRSDEETIIALYQQIGALQQRIDTMERHRTDGDLNTIALVKAREIEDLFTQHHPGGRSQRLARIQIIVRETIRRALTGETDFQASSDMQTLREPIGD